MVAVGHELGLKVVAECVETAEQVEFLKGIGVDYAQGFYFARPMTKDALEAWLPRADCNILQFAAAG
jgi:cyclic di-GMP phosphodiesterase Gmr